MSELKRTHDETAIQWFAHDFLNGIKEDEYRIIRSPPFVFGTSTLCLKLAGSFLRDLETTTLGVIILNKTNYLLRDNYQLQCTYGLKNIDGTVEQLGITTMKTDVDESRHHFSKLTEVMREKIKRFPTRCVSLKITFKVEILHDTEPQCKRLKKEDVLSQNFKDLFVDKSGCDTIIHVKDRKFKAHRAVLIARSNVFAAMFQHDTSEKQTGIIPITDCDPDSFPEFLEYLYCGRLEESSSQSALHLYETSEKYNVAELKMFCVEILLKNMELEIFCDIALLADKYDDIKLLCGAQDFFNKMACEIVETSDWNHLTKNNSPLCNKLLNGLKELTEAKLNQSIARAKFILSN